MKCNSEILGVHSTSGRVKLVRLKKPKHGVVECTRHKVEYNFLDLRSPSVKQLWSCEDVIPSEGVYDRVRGNVY